MHLKLKYPNNQILWRGAAHCKKTTYETSDSGADMWVFTAFLDAPEHPRHMAKKL